MKKRAYTLTSAQPPALFQVALPYYPDPDLIPMIIPCQNDKECPFILHARAQIVLIFPMEYAVVRAEVRHVVFAMEISVARHLHSLSPRCPVAVMMPRTLHPMALGPLLWQHTVLVSPLHSKALINILHISHLLSQAGCAWN